MVPGYPAFSPLTLVGPKQGRLTQRVREIRRRRRDRVGAGGAELVLGADAPEDADGADAVFTGGDRQLFVLPTGRHYAVVRESVKEDYQFKLSKIVPADNRSLDALMQSWLRTKAKGFADFKKVMDLRSNNSNNTVFADDQGNIAYWHGNFMPKRNSRFDYSLPVDGSISATDWKGIHQLDEKFWC